jgi:hypothetical protein
MPRIAGGLGGTRHWSLFRKATVVNKHLGGSKIAGAIATCPAGMRRFTSRMNVMAQTVREKARIRQGRDDDRLSEDDITRARLGPRGQEGTPDTAKMTEDSRLQTPEPLDPGHTA